MSSGAPKTEGHHSRTVHTGRGAALSQGTRQHLKVPSGVTWHLLWGPGSLTFPESQVAQLYISPHTSPPYRPYSLCFISVTTLPLLIPYLFRSLIRQREASWKSGLGTQGPYPSSASALICSMIQATLSLSFSITPPGQCGLDQCFVETDPQMASVGVL